MVDMGITRFWILGPKSRSVNNSSQRSDFGLLGLIFGHNALHPKAQQFHNAAPSSQTLLGWAGDL